MPSVKLEPVFLVENEEALFVMLVLNYSAHCGSRLGQGVSIETWEII